MVCTETALQVKIWFLAKWVEYIFLAAFVTQEPSKSAASVKKRNIFRGLLRFSVKSKISHCQRTHS